MATGFKTAQVNASSVPATATDFPSYVDLDRLGITTTAEAESVRVYADEAKTTEWAREIVSATEMHVKVPSLTTTTDIYVDWDGIRSDYATTATYGAEAVWATNYNAVYHLESLTADSTANANTLTNVNSVGAGTGVWGDASSASDTGTTNTNERLRRTDDIGSNGQAARTWTCWVKINTQVGTNANYNLMYQIYRANNTGGQRGLVYRDTAGTKQLRFEYQMGTDSGGGASVAETRTLTTSEWVYLTYTNTQGNTSDVKFYVDGVLIGTNSSVDQSLKFNANNGEGTNQIALFNGENTAYSPAVIDESRWQNLVRSDNWITTEYNNQSDEATFWGTWSEVGGGATFTPTSMVF